MSVEKMSSTFKVEVDGKVSEISIENGNFLCTGVGRNTKGQTISVEDILCIRKAGDGDNLPKKHFAEIHYISRKVGKPEWKPAKLKISGETETCSGLVSELEQLFQPVYEKRPKRLLFLINPISGKATARTDHKKIIQPLFDLANVTCDVVVSERSKHFSEVVSSYDWKSINGIVVMGGDGSFSEVINAALNRNQKEKGIDVEDKDSPVEPLPFCIGLIPSGTGNGMAKSLYKCYDMVTAALHIIKGVTVKTNTMAVYSGDKFVAFAGMLFCYGLFGDMIYHTDAQRWMRRARYVVIPFWVVFVKKFRNFTAKMTLFNSKRKVISEDGTKSVVVEKEETVDGPFMSTMMAPGSIMGPSVEEETQRSTIFLMRNTSAISLMKVVYLFFDKPDQEHDLSKFQWLIPRETESILIEVLEREEHPLNFIVNIDGEIHNVTELKLFARTHANVFTMYGSSKSTLQTNAGDTATATPNQVSTESTMATNSGVTEVTKTATTVQSEEINLEVTSQETRTEQKDSAADEASSQITAEPE